MSQLNFLDKLYEKQTTQKEVVKTIKKVVRSIRYSMLAAPLDTNHSLLEECCVRLELICGPTTNFNSNLYNHTTTREIIDSRCVSDALRELQRLFRLYELSDFENKVLFKVIKELEIILNKSFKNESI